MILTATVPALAAAKDRAARVAQTASDARLENGAPSSDALIQRFLQALDQKDERALRSLRTTESEYRSIILPGTVPPGAPRRHYRKDVADYFWGVMNAKSAYYEQYLINTAGGRGPSTLKLVTYKKGRQQYADYTAYKQLRLVVEDGAGHEQDIRTGSIVEVGGRYKFISFIRD